MARYAALISLGLGLGMLGLFHGPFFPEPPAHSRFRLNPVEMERTARRLDDLLQAREQFVAIYDGIVERLLRSELSLTQACDRIYEDAQMIYPNFLRNQRKDDRFTLKERLARNLVGSIVLDAQENPSNLDRVSQLERDLLSRDFLQWCRQPWPGQDSFRANGSS